MNSPVNHFWARLTRSIFGLGALGGLLLWLAQPPCGWHWLAWLAPIPWVLLITEPVWKGRRPWVQVWMAAWMYWLCSLYFIPIPHVLLWPGWGLLAAYEALLLTGFFVLCRQAIWKLGLSPLVVIPLVWTSVEWMRTQTEYGFGMFALSHTQYRQPMLLQVADLFGAYGLSWCIMTFATGLAWAWRHRPNRASGESPSDGQRACGLGLVVAAIGFTFPVAYGLFRLEPSEPSGVPVRKALVIQGAIDTIFPKTRDEAFAFQRKQIEDYRRITLQARESVPDADLVLWPESIFVFPLEYAAPAATPLAEGPTNADYLLKAWRYCTSELFDPSSATSALPPIEAIFGAPVLVAPGDQTHNHQFNSVVHFPDFLRYDKNVRVPFGEFIPVLDWFHGLEELSPIGKGLSRGSGPVAMPLKASTGEGGTSTPLIVLPNVCFESTVPQRIRRHVNQIEKQGLHVDWLANFTNDGWFYGTSCLDLHLSCTVFRSVEMRRPTVVAANTGFSAEIDSSGRIRQQGPRRAEGYLVVPLTRQPSRFSLYRVVGDTPWFLSTLLCGMVFLSFFRIPRV